MITLLTVPRPGRCPSGIHSSSTTTPTKMPTVPIGMPVRSDKPWWNTSHGASPRRACTKQGDAQAEEEQAHVQVHQSAT